MKIRKIHILFVAVAFLSPFSYGQEAKEDNSAVMEALVVAKATGMCGLIKQMTAFQESTKMPGGDEFIMRFLRTEAARLGHTLPDFLAQCKSAVEVYTNLMGALQAE